MIEVGGIEGRNHYFLLNIEIIELKEHIPQAQNNTCEYPKMTSASNKK